MSIPTDYTYNVIDEVMNYGAGDYAWLETLVKYLKKNGVPNDKIRIIAINTYDWGSDLSTIIIKKLSLYNDQFKNNSGNCAIVTADNIEERKENLGDVITYRFQKNNSLKNECTMRDFNNNLYKDDKYNVVSDFKNISNIIGDIVKGIMTDVSDIKSAIMYVKLIKKQ